MKEINLKALEIVRKGKQEERKYLCEKDFSLFFLYYFTHFLGYKFAPFHFEMFADLESLMANKYRELVWILFRESAKTSIAKAFLTWLIVYKKKMYINVDSFDKENAEALLFDVVTYLQSNQKLVEDFGQFYNESRDASKAQIKRINNFVTSNGVRVEAHTTQESVRGRLFDNQRPDFLLLDDIETNKTKDSKAHTLQVIKHIDEFKSGLSVNASVLYLGNYITEFGIMHELLERAKTDNRMKVIFKGVEEDGVIQWPDKYVFTNAEAEPTKQSKHPKVSLEDKKKFLGSLVYSAEMLNKPIDEETAVFKKMWFRSIKQSEVDRMQTSNFLTIDTAVSKAEEADYTGMCDNSVNSENRWHLNAWRRRMTPTELIDTMFTLHARRRYEKIGIEKGMYSLVLKPFLDEEQRKRNVFLPIVELSHGGRKKEERIMSIVPRYETGSVFHIEGQCLDLEDELVRFPKSVHDDVSDATAYQSQLARAPYAEATDTDENEVDKALYADIGI